MIFDSFGRRLRYLRISVTDRCNLRCVYCRPEAGVRLYPHDEILSYEEIERVARVAVGLGMDSLRLTGGEPLVRKDICHLVEQLSRIEGLADLSLTTNGLLLGKLAGPLRAAGLRRVNISLDTLDEVRFARLTRGGEIGQALAGLGAALAAGLEPVKLNVVLFAEAEGQPTAADILAFAEMSRSLPVHVRFIEWMPLNGQRQAGDPAAERVWRILAGLAELQQTPGPQGNGPARYFRYEGAAGTVGFITPQSAPFCDRCSRLRLTSTGKLKLCLLQEQELDLREPLRGGADDEQLAALFRQAAQNKPAGYPKEIAELASMCQIGG